MKIILLILSSIIMVFSSCSESSDNLKDMKSEYLKEILINNESNEFIDLLSAKYNLNVDLTRKIIDEFREQDLLFILTSISDAETIEEFNQVKENLKRPSVSERIIKISMVNNIEPSIIASLIIDYKIWHNSKYKEDY